MLWHPDETTLAWSQLYLPAVQWRALRSEEADTETELDNALAVNRAIEVLVQARTPAWHAREWLITCAWLAASRHARCSRD